MRSSHVAPVTNSSAADDGGSGTFDGDAPLLISASGEVSTNEYACTPAGIYYSSKDFIFGILSVYTPKFSAFMTINYLLIKGFSFQATTYVMLPYFKDLGVSGSDYQKYYNIVMMAFGLKPAIGALSDAVPIFGYNKRYYNAFFSVMCAVCLFCVNLLPTDNSSAPYACLLFFGCCTAVASLDLLTEGKYAEIMSADKTGRGPSVVTFIWIWYMLGGLAGAAVEGTLAEAEGPAFVIWLIAPWSLLLLLPSLRGWMPEVRHQVRAITDEFTPIISSAASQHKGTVALGVAASGVAVTLAILSLLATDFVVLGGLIILSTAMLGASFAVLPPAIAKANLFMYFKELFYLQINGSLDYYYTASASCIADAPHFSYSYYQSLANTIGNVAGLGGALLFQRCFITGSFRAVFVFTTVLKIVASVFDLVIVMRWNESLGIPDKATYMFGDAVIFQAMQMLDFMPTVILMSRLCPKGMEATIYAFMAGLSNLGQASSRSLGYMISDWLKIRTTVPCDFTNLAPLIVMTHMLMPLMILPLIVLLVPPGKMTEGLKADLDDRPATPPPEFAEQKDEENHQVAHNGASPDRQGRSATDVEEGQFGVFKTRSSVATTTNGGATTTP